MPSQPGPGCSWTINPSICPTGKPAESPPKGPLRLSRPERRRARRDHDPARSGDGRLRPVRVDRPTDGVVLGGTRCEAEETCGVVQKFLIDVQPLQRVEHRSEE